MTQGGLTVATTSGGTAEKWSSRLIPRRWEEKATGLESKPGETDKEKLPHTTLHATHRMCTQKPGRG